MIFKVYKKRQSKIKQIDLTPQIFMSFIQEIKLQSKFDLHQIETYDTFTKTQLQSLSEAIISYSQLSQLMINELKICYLLQPLIQALEFKQFKSQTNIKIKDILKTLVTDQYYRFLPQISSLENNRTTELNVKIIITSLILFSSKRMTIQEISNTVLIFTLEETSYNVMRIGIPISLNKISSIIRKIQRNIKPEILKQRVQNLKIKEANITNSNPESIKHIKIDQFLYLVGVSEKSKTNTGLNFFRKKHSFLIANNQEKVLDTILKQIQTKQMSNQVQKPQNKVRGIHFQKQSSKQKHNELYIEIKRSLSHKVNQKSQFLIEEINKTRSKTPISRFSLKPQIYQNSLFLKCHQVKQLNNKCTIYEKRINFSNLKNMKGKIVKKKINKLKNLYDKELRIFSGQLKQQQKFIEQFQQEDLNFKSSIILNANKNYLIAGYINKMR